MEASITAIREAKHQALHAVHRINAADIDDFSKGVLIGQIQDVATSLQAIENSAVRIKSRRDIEAELAQRTA